MAIQSTLKLKLHEISQNSFLKQTQTNTLKIDQMQIFMELRLNNLTRNYPILINQLDSINPLQLDKPTHMMIIHILDQGQNKLIHIDMILMYQSK